MKELSMEEKAKAYDETIERAKRMFSEKELNYLFPELAESEDEKIRKAIIKALRSHSNSVNSLSSDGFKMEDVISWLEKQGEQKPADKVEPKFKVGDWVVCKNGSHQVFQVIERSWPNAKYRDIKGTEIFLNVFTLDKQYRPWTIQDAKDGDVLYSDLMDGKTFIYGGINSDGAILYSFIINNSGEDVLPYNIGKLNTGIGYIEENKNIIHPATKEQRDLLFQKMKEAGYEWDAEKKELKKIEQKPLWGEEDEKNYDTLLKIMCASNKSEELLNKLYDWFKSLKDRVQPQYITITDEELAQAKKDAYNDVLDKIEYNSENPTFDDGWSAAIWYLKKRTAQPQTTWKPSDEEMNSLKQAINSFPYETDYLDSLYEELKKLREDKL